VLSIPLCQSTESTGRRVCNLDGRVVLHIPEVLDLAHCEAEPEGFVPRKVLDLDIRIANLVGRVSLYPPPVLLTSLCGAGWFAALESVVPMLKLCDIYILKYMVPEERPYIPPGCRGCTSVDHEITDIVPLLAPLVSRSLSLESVDILLSQVWFPWYKTAVDLNRPSWEIKSFHSSISSIQLDCNSEDTISRIFHSDRTWEPLDREYSENPGVWYRAQVLHGVNVNILYRSVSLLPVYLVPRHTE